MSEEFSSFNEDERLKAENDFLKMKLMLEHDVKFDGDENTELPAEIENEFLNNMVAFEKQFEERKRIKVFDKIGRPAHFKPVNEIPDNEIDAACDELLNYLNDYNIDLGVCSPNISKNELYRFAIEELFDHEMDDMNLPGWSTNFIYDEFYPDPVYENTRTASQDCIGRFLSKGEVEWLSFFKKDGLQLNAHSSLTQEQLKHLVNQFKAAYDELEMSDNETNPQCIINDDFSTVAGKYSLEAISSGKQFHLSGNWKVDFVYDRETGYWEINNVQIEGINF